jgi:glycosyltransferase involved in cell wall biosynthesis
MNIKTLVISSFSGSGISDRAQIASLIGLIQKGVTMHFLMHENSPQIPFFEKQGITYTTHTIKSKIDKKAIQTIRNIIKEKKIDIIHSFNNNATSNAVQAAKGLQVKIISYRGFTGHVHWYKPTSLMNNLHPRVSRIACVSNAVRDQVRSQLWRNKNKAVTIYKGHDMSWYENITPTLRNDLNVPENAFLIGIVANIRPMKGVKYFIKAANYLANHKNIHFVLIGRGMDSDAIQEQINNTPLTENFHCFGFRKNVLEDVAAFDIGVNSSIKGEGLSKTTIEAMSLKKPVIATDAGGNAELVINKKTGLLIPIKNPEAIANAILTYKNDIELQKQMAEAGYAHIANNFTVEKTVEETFAMYKELKTELNKTHN